MNSYNFKTVESIQKIVTDELGILMENTISAANINEQKVGTTEYFVGDNLKLQVSLIQI